MVQRRFQALVFAAACYRIGIRICRAVISQADPVSLSSHLSSLLLEFVSLAGASQCDDDDAGGKSVRMRQGSQVLRWVDPRYKRAASRNAQGTVCIWVRQAFVSSLILILSCVLWPMLVSTSDFLGGCIVLSRPLATHSDSPDFITF